MTQTSYDYGIMNAGKNMTGGGGPQCPPFILTAVALGAETEAD